MFTSCLHRRSSVTNQYNLVLANGRWCSAAEEVTTGLAESNGSLPPGLRLRSPAGWLPRTRISSGTLHSFRVWDYLLQVAFKMLICRCDLKKRSITLCDEECDGWLRGVLDTFEDFDCAAAAALRMPDWLPWRPATSARLFRSPSSSSSLSSVASSSSSSLPASDSSSTSTQASEVGGVQGIWHPNYLCGGLYVYVYPP